MPELTIKCAKCGKASESKATSRGEARLPRGWKRNGGVWCSDCWHNAYMMRAVTIPVAGPVSCDWESLRESLRTAWGESTRLANWLATQYYVRDVRRQPGETKLPAMPKIYLYPEARAECEELTPRTTVAIDHAIQGKYRAARLKLLWTNEISLPNFRYPFPLPLPSDCFHLKLGEDNELLCELRLLSSLPWVTLRLRGGRDYARQRRSLEKCIAGEAVPVEATLYRITSHPGDHRPGERPTSRVMLKIAAWLPRVARGQRSGEKFLSLKTDQECFWYGILEDREQPWVLNADQVRDWVHQHQRDLRRLGEDRKHEDRRDRNKRKRYRQTLAAKSQKFFNRIDSFIKESSSAAVGLCQRSGVTRLKYDDGYRGYVDSFPWAKLRQQLSMKCDEFGITLEFASSEVSVNSDAPLDNSST